VLIQLAEIILIVKDLFSNTGDADEENPVIYCFFLTGLGMQEQSLILQGDLLFHEFPVI
jgi:hypothetical protein